MALSGTFEKYPVNGFGLYCTWSASQSVTGNYSDVTLNVYLKYYTISVGARSDSTISINGTSETYTAPAINDYTSGTKTKLLKTKTVRVTHNANGTKTGVPLSASWRFSGTYSGVSIGTITASATIDLNPIDRTAPTVSCSVSSITANGFKITATSSATADVWQYSTNGGTGSGFVGTIQGYRELYGQYRPDYIEATKLSNHDEDRAGSSLNRDSRKMQLAAAVLLTGPGEPYIYQGEELGYWGVKTNGDEYVRTPIMWNADGGGLADGKLSGKVDRSMLTAGMSVESQSADEKSILNVYRKFGVLRDSYPALAKGSFDYCPATASVQALSAWYRSYGDQKILVVHNFGASTAKTGFPNDRLDRMIASNGTVTVNGNNLSMGGYATAIFLQ